MSLMNNRSLSKSTGFTLLEVLIAVVIFAIGLLGIAGLQVAGMRYTHGSQLRAVATIQAENMADRMRANKVGLAAGKYNVEGTMPTSYSVDCSVADCDTGQLAEYDLVVWNVAAADGKPHESNADVLPSGKGVVCIDSTPDDGGPDGWECDNEGIVYAIKIAWEERTAGRDDAATDDGDEDTESEIIQQQLYLRVVP